MNIINQLGDVFFLNNQTNFLVICVISVESFEAQKHSVPQDGLRQCSILTIFDNSLSDMCIDLLVYSSLVVDLFFWLFIIMIYV